MRTSTHGLNKLNKASRLVLVCGVIPVVLAMGLAIYRPASLANWDYSVYDSLVRQAGTRPHGGKVAIVEIDERSISTIGQWPWRRDLVGRLITRLRELGAAAVALDIVFAEPDRYELPADASNTTIREPLASAPGDAALARALRGGRVVLGYALRFENPDREAGDCVLHPMGVATVLPRGGPAEGPLFRASGALCSLPVLAQAAEASGFLNAAPDADGILRRTPLLIELDGHVYPGLALAAVAAVQSPREAVLRTVNVNTASLTLDDRTIPLDGKSNLLLRYRGRNRSFPYISAADVLGGRLAAGALKDKVVFVGATAVGIRELMATPLDPRTAGVEVQATVADNLLEQDYLFRPEHAVALEAQIVLAVGIALALIVGFGGLAWGSLAVGIGLVALWGGATWLLSNTGAFLSPLFPSLGLISAFSAMTLAKFSVERQRAERAGQEKTTSQRLMVQTLLSLTEVRDAETGRHSRRTQLYTRLVAEQLSQHPRFREYLTPSRIDLLASLAPLHDIGKVGVPDRLLNKPGSLTSEELIEIRKHPAHGRDVIVQAERHAGTKDDQILSIAKEIVYTHHERWDGSGYPQGLRGEQIPIPGRLIALVDVYDALISKRVYRDAVSHDQAIGLICAGRGTHFDPAVVDAFLRGARFLNTITHQVGA